MAKKNGNLEEKASKFREDAEGVRQYFEKMATIEKEYWFSCFVASFNKGEMDLSNLLCMAVLIFGFGEAEKHIQEMIPLEIRRQAATGTLSLAVPENHKEVVIRAYLGADADAFLAAA
jgi:hypothetical protein